MKYSMQYCLSPHDVQARIQEFVKGEGGVSSKNFLKGC